MTVMQAAHVMAFIPLVALWLMGQRLGRHWFAAWAFWVSFPVELVALMLDGMDTWLVSNVLPVVQLPLFALALGSRYLAGAVVVVCALVLLAFRQTPDVWAVTLGSCIILTAALVAPTDLSWALWVFCGLGTLFYLGMIQHTDDYGRFMPWWYAYQGARLTAFGLFIHAARREA